MGVRDKMKNLLFYILFSIILVNGGNSREFLLTDVVDKDIKIRTSFAGAQIFLYGTFDPELFNKAEILVVIQGPRKDVILRKKYRKFGIWVTGDEKIYFRNIPSYYATASSGPLNKEIFDNFFISKQIGWGNIKSSNYGNTNGLEHQAIGKSLIDEGLLSENNTSVEIFNKSLFKAVFDVPAVTPTGIYTAQTYLIGKNGKLIAEWENKIKVSKEGLAEELYEFSRNKSLFYGIFAALGALIAGFLASEAFRRI